MQLLFFGAPQVPAQLLGESEQSSSSRYCKVGFDSPSTDPGIVTVACVKWTLNSDVESKSLLRLQIRRTASPPPHAVSRARHDRSWRNLEGSLLPSPHQSSTGVLITLSEVSGPVHGICSTELSNGGTVICLLHVHLQSGIFHLTCMVCGSAVPLANACHRWCLTTSLCLLPHPIGLLLPSHEPNPKS